MIHVYALVRGLPMLPQSRGIDNEALQRIEFVDADAIVSSCSGASSDAETDDLVRHSEVIDAIQSHADAVLPMRFGERFSDEDALASALESRWTEVRRALERVGGCVEIALRVFGTSDHVAETTVPAASGSDYMHARLDRLVEREGVVAAAHEPLARLAREAVTSQAGDGDVLHQASYLLPRSELDPFMNVVNGLSRDHPELIVVCTGPWAPHSFSALEVHA
jgi:hypothetical protein